MYSRDDVGVRVVVRYEIYIYIYRLKDVLFIVLSDSAKIQVLSFSLLARSRIRAIPHHFVFWEISSLREKYRLHRFFQLSKSDLKFDAFQAKCIPPLL